MAFALLFSGQGGQHADMLPWLDEAPDAGGVLARLSDSLGAPWRELLQAPGARRSNAIAQAVVTATSLAAWSVLRPLLQQVPEIVAGYSVGELAACGAADVFSVADACELARARAEAMDRAADGHETGLLAIGGLTEQQVRDANPQLQLAIRIGPDSNIFGGTRLALEDAQHRLAGRADFTPICVALASHTSWMQDAQPAFARVLQSVQARSPVCPVALNATGAATLDRECIVEALVSQLTRPVEWAACMSTVAERRPACVLEIGGGRALAGMWSRRYPETPCRSLDEFRSAAGAARWIEAHALAG